VNEYTIAIHEAGHAVISMMLQRTFEFVTIISSDETHGSCSYKVTNLDEYSMCFRSFKRKIKREVMVLFAGYIASENDKLPADWRETEIDSDIDKAFDLIIRVSGTEEQVVKHFNKFWLDTVKLVKQPLIQQQIKAVADALMERKTLSGYAVKQIVKQVEKTLRKGANSMEKQKYITIEEFCEYLKIPRRKALEMCRCKEIPAVKYGRFWRVNKEKLDQQMARKML